jgi:hypothetical protein
MTEKGGLMKIRCLFLSLAVMVWCSTAGFAASEVVKLQRTSPQETARVLQATFGRALGIAEAPMINAVVIRGDDPRLVAEAAALARQLDRPGATLRFTVMAQDRSHEQNRRLGIHRRGITADTQHRTGQNQEMRTLVGTENHPLSLVDELTTPFTWETGWGAETVLIKKRAGLQISGRLGEDGTVTISIWYGQGLGETSSQLISQVSGPLGQWLDLGAVVTDGSSTSGGAALGKQGRLGKSVHQQGGARQYRVKVDLVSD